MKSRLITAIALLAVSVGAAVLCVVHVNKCADELGGALETALASAATESPGWEDATGEVLRVWEEHGEFLHILLPHVNLNELEWTIGALPEYLAQRDRPLFVEQCVRGLQCLETVREMERPSWGNIF
jgi:hypothetical protein